MAVPPCHIIYVDDDPTQRQDSTQEACKNSKIKYFIQLGGKKDQVGPEGQYMR